MSDLAEHGEGGDDAGNLAPPSNGLSTIAQKTAQSSLDQLLGLLNSQAGDRYLFSGTRHRPAGGRVARPHSQRQRRAGRPQAAYRRAQPGRSRRRRARPPGHQPADRDLGLARGRRRLAVRLQARLGHFVAHRRDCHRPDRLAGRAFGRSRRRQSERRRQHHRALQPARRHQRKPDAHRHHHRRRPAPISSPSAQRRPRPPPICKRAHHVDRQARRHRR